MIGGKPMTRKNAAIAALVAVGVFIFFSTIRAADVREQRLKDTYEAKITQLEIEKEEIKKNKEVKPTTDFNKEQSELLIYAYKVAQHDGFKDPTLIQGIIMQESKVGTYKDYKVAGHEFGLKPLARYYGVAQMKLNAAKDVLAKYPSLGKFKTEEELVANMITDKKFAVRLASKYLVMLGAKNEPKMLVAARYNRGKAGAEAVDPSTFPYSVSVNKYANGVMAKLNKKNKLLLASS